MSGAAPIPLCSIELDTTIQCRADIDIATVNEYAEAMTAGADFPPVHVFGSKDKSWIGDGWHRVMAARSVGLSEIRAVVHPGDRLDALKHALSANAVHGRRRTNADKRCAVAIALREWGKLSDGNLAEMCSVSQAFVSSLRRALGPTGQNGFDLSTRLGRDGKEYPAHREAPAPPEPTPEPRPMPALGSPRMGMQFARHAITNLEQIRDDDLERDEALQTVRGWLDDHDA